MHAALLATCPHGRMSFPWQNWLGINLQNGGATSMKIGTDMKICAQDYLLIRLDKHYINEFDLTYLLIVQDIYSLVYLTGISTLKWKTLRRYITALS